jgi:uncharacterized membrane protein YphA (DoxX/SURF4 family)
MSWLWTVRLLRWSYAAFIAQASAVTFFAPGHSGHAGVVVRILAASEFLAAAVFALGIVDRVACTVLLVVYAIATALSVADAEWPLRFFYYAATAILITQVAQQPSRRPA